MSYNDALRTNNEELGEILQQVYNLPNASSGGSEPDLVITLDTAGNNYQLSESQASMDGEQVIETYRKLVNGEAVNCVAKFDMWFDSGAPTQYHLRAITYTVRSDSNEGKIRFFFEVPIPPTTYCHDIGLLHIDIRVSQ